jgi:hypothetical protein
LFTVLIEKPHFHPLPVMLPNQKNLFHLLSRPRLKKVLKVSNKR